MSPRVMSVIAFLVLGIVIAYLLFTHSLFGTGLIAIALQVVSLLLIVWVRLVFGRRSFHAAADPTPGPLVTMGPYRYVRHPIHAATLLFTLTGIASHLSLETGALAVVIVALVWIRVVSEERLLRARYPDYEHYAQTTVRLIPFVF